MSSSWKWPIRRARKEVEPKCAPQSLWDRYWGRAGQLLANIFPVPINGPKSLCEPGQGSLSFLKWRLWLPWPHENDPFFNISFSWLWFRLLGMQNPTHPRCSFPVHGNRRFVSPLIYEKPAIIVLCRCLNSVTSFSSVKFKTSREKTIIRTRMPTRLKTNVQSTLFSLWMNNSNVYHLPFFFCKFFLHNSWNWCYHSNWRVCCRLTYKTF